MPDVTRPEGTEFFDRLDPGLVMAALGLCCVVGGVAMVLLLI
ncbi:MAG: hypothetical protein ACE5MK_05595 [Acidobacteriota bacterium]